MKIEFKCENCESVLRLDSIHIGRPARCPVCGTVSQVPEQAVENLGGTDDWRSLGSEGIANKPLAEEPQTGFRTSDLPPPAQPDSTNPWNAPTAPSPIRQPSQSAGDKDGMWVWALVFGIISVVVHFVLCGCGSFLSPVFSIMGLSATLFSRSSPKLPLVILNCLGLLFSMIALGLLIVGMAFR